MIRVILEFVQFLLANLPLLTSVAIFTLLSIWLAKSIKKHSKIYYFILAIPFVLVAVPTILRWCGVPLPVNFVGMPVLGQILRDYIHMGTLGHPLLIIIMYMGALDPKRSYTKKLMSIRKELSIIVGFPVLTHSLIRVANNFPRGWQFFFNNEEYMANTQVTSTLGAGFTSFSFVLGILMLALFLPLWITSFDSVRKRMNAVKWKKLQKWSYVLYATLFIHAITLVLGGMLNPRAPRPSPPPVAEMVETGRAPSLQNEPRQRETTQGSGRRPQARGFADFEISRQTRQYAHLTSLVLIYGSYLFFRVRKHRRQQQRKKIMNGEM